MKNNQDSIHTPQDLVTQLQGLVTEAQALMSGALTETSPGAFSALQARFTAAQERFADLYAGAKKKVVDGARCTDEAIRANPYQSIAIAAGVGVLVGVLLSRRGE